MCSQHTAGTSRGSQAGASMPEVWPRVLVEQSVLSKDELPTSLSTAGIFNVTGLNNHNLCQNSLLSSRSQRHNDFIAISGCCFLLSLLQSKGAAGPRTGCLEDT